jgi:hypothetical protein
MCFSCPLYYLSQLHQVNHDGKFGMSTELNGLNNRHLVGLYAWHAQNRDFYKWIESS